MRPLRIKNEIDESGYFHLIARCVGKRFYFEKPEERDRVKLWLDKAVAFSGVKLYGYCIMSNHVHLLIQVPPKRDVSDAELDSKMRGFYHPDRYDAIMAQWDTWRRIDKNEHRVDEAKEHLKRRMFDVSMFMKTFKQCVAEDYNLRNQHSGSVWGGARFKSVYLDGSLKVMNTVLSYIHLNPVRAGIMDDAGNYGWSSYGRAIKGDVIAQKMLVEMFNDCSNKKEWAWKDVKEIQTNHVGEDTKNRNATNKQLLLKQSPKLSGLLIIASSQNYVNELFMRRLNRTNSGRTTGNMFFGRRKHCTAKAFSRIIGLVGVGDLRKTKGKVFNAA